MKKVLIICFAILLLLSGCTKHELAPKPYELVLDSEQIREIYVRDMLTTGEVLTIDFEEDINHFCSEFNKIKFHHIKTYSDKEARPAGSMYAINISLKGGSSISFSIIDEKTIQIGDDIYRTSGDGLMKLMDYDFQYAELRAVYEFAEEINEKLSNYEHFKGTEVDAGKGIITVYSSSMAGDVIDEFRRIIGDSEYSIICLSAE